MPSSSQATDIIQSDVDAPSRAKDSLKLAAELREVYRVIFASKPTIKVDIGRINCAGEDLALVIGRWESTAQTPVGDTKVWSGTYTDIVRKQPDGTWKLVLDNPNGVDVRTKQSA